MSHLFRLSLVLVAGLLAATLGAFSAQAQNAKGELKELPKVQVSGKVESIRPGYIQLAPESLRVTYPKLAANENPPPRTSDDDLLKMKQVVAIEQRTRSSVTAMTDLSFVKPGSGLRISGKVDANGVVAGELGSAEVFAPDANFKPTMEITVAFSGFVGDKKESVAPFKAEGIVASQVKGRTILVVKDNQRLQLTLAQDCKVNFASTNYAMAQPGDHISVSGRLQAPGQIIGETVTITLASLPGEKKKQPAKVLPSKKTEEKKAAEKKTEEKAEAK